VDGADVETVAPDPGDTDAGGDVIFEARRDWEE